jgi:hypothetical protein
VSSTITGTVSWHAARDEFPDAEQTVLVSMAGDGPDSDPVWIGFTDGKTWFDACTGAEFVGRVTHWAELPMQVQP